MVDTLARAGDDSGQFRADERVWYKVKQGMQGLLVQDRQGREMVYMVTEPSTRYYQVMTSAEWMPRLIDEVI